MVDLQRLQDQKIIKLAALTASILVVSIGFIARAGSGSEHSAPSAGVVLGGSDGGRKLMGGWDSNGWSGGELSSKTSKCGKSIGGGSGSYAGKTGKVGGGLRRLEDRWARIWVPPNTDGESNWQPSWGADSSGSWDDDDDCDPSTDESQSDVLVFVKNGKAAKAKSSKSKSAKSKLSKNPPPAMSSTNDWSSPGNHPSKMTDRAENWSSPWTPPSEPLWGSSTWKASPVPTPAPEKSVPTLRVTEDPTHKPAYVPTPKPVPTRIEVTTEDVSRELCEHVEFNIQKHPVH